MVPFLSKWWLKYIVSMELKKAWKSFENILPQFLSVLVIIGIMLAVLSTEVISGFCDRHTSDYADCICH